MSNTIDENQLQTWFAQENWEELVKCAVHPSFFSWLLTLESSVLRRVALEALLVRGMEHHWLDLMVRDLAWKRRLEDVDHLIGIGANQVWAAIGLALAGDLVLADQYWSQEFALEGDSWRGPLVTALQQSCWPALGWMLDKGADAAWVLEEDLCISNSDALGVLLEKIKNPNLVSWELWSQALGLKSWKWSGQRFCEPDFPLSDLEFSWWLKLIDKSYSHPNLWLLMARQGKLEQIKVSHQWSIGQFVGRDVLMVEWARLLLSCESVSEFGDWTRFLDSIGLDWCKLMGHGEGAVSVLEQLVLFRSLSDVQSWWPQFLIFGVKSQELLHLVLKHRRISWVSWVLTLKGVDPRHSKSLSLAANYPPSFRKKFGME